MRLQWGQCWCQPFITSSSNGRASTRQQEQQFDCLVPQQTLPCQVLDRCCTRPPSCVHGMPSSLPCWLTREMKFSQNWHAWNLFHKDLLPTGQQCKLWKFGHSWQSIQCFAKQQCSNFRTVQVYQEQCRALWSNSLSAVESNCCSGQTCFLQISVQCPLLGLGLLV